MVCSPQIGSRINQANRVFVFVVACGADFNTVMLLLELKLTKGHLVNKHTHIIQRLSLLKVHHQYESEIHNALIRKYL